MFDLSRYNHQETCPCSRCDKSRECQVEVKAVYKRHTSYTVKSPSGNTYFAVVDANERITCNCKNGGHAYWATCSHQQAVRWHIAKQKAAEAAKTVKMMSRQEQEEALPANFSVAANEEGERLWA